MQRTPQETIDEREKDVFHSMNDTGITLQKYSPWISCQFCRTNIHVYKTGENFLVCGACANAINKRWPEYYKNIPPSYSETDSR